ncbi:hypothetical protein BGX30_005239 [Mortierella sp. GBA39]|nr:hypothetical protein BGX30_005239 [Mortierella sp. GBA39]
MDLYITTSSRLTPAEEEELRSNSGSTEQLQDPTPNDYPVKSAKLGSATSSPVIPAVVFPSFSALGASPSAATGPVKSKMLVPIAIVVKNQQQQSESQQGSPGRRSIDDGYKETLQEEVRSQIQASASMDDDRDDLVDQSRQFTQLPTPIQRQQQQKPPIPIDKAPNDRKQYLSKPTSLSLPSSGITPTILVSASSPSPTVKLPSTLSSPRTTTTTSGNSSHGEKSNAVVVLEPSKPVRKLTIQKDPRGPVFDTQLSSSGASIHSTSPTVIPATSFTGGRVLQQRRTSSLGSHTSLTTTLVTGSSIQQHPSTSSLALEAAGPPPATPPLDTQHFATVFHELTKSIEQLETLNDQILEKMTLYRPPPPPPAPAQQQAFIVPQPEQRSHSPSSTRCLPPSPQPSQSPASTTPLGTPPPSAHHYQTHLPAHAPTPTTGGNNDNGDDGWRRILKGKARAVNLEDDRQSIAQSFTDLVMDSWPRIYKIPPEPWRTPQMRQDRIKTATRLKDAIVTFWSVQSYFQERAELILDVQQNSAELENGSRFRILKAQHLDNLLSQEPLHSLEIKRILDQHRQQQDQLTALSEQLQNVWLGILLLLGDPDLTGKSTTATAGGKLSHHRRLHMDSMHQLFSTGGGSSSSGYSLDYRYSESGRGGGDGEGGEGSGRRGLLRLSRNKRLGLKVAVLMIFGAGMIAMALVVNTR